MGKVEDRGGEGYKHIKYNKMQVSKIQKSMKKYYQSSHRTTRLAVLI